MALPKGHRVSVFSLSSGRALVDRVCRRLGVTPSAHEERSFEDGEHKLRPLESVRGRDVYLVEALFGEPSLSVNDKLVRLLFFIACLKDAGAQRVTAVAPYLCYARKDVRTKPRDPVSTRSLAMLFEAVKTDRVVAIEVHNPAAYQNAFRIPAEHLTAASCLVDAFIPLIGDNSPVVVSPDAGGVKRAEHFRQVLERRLGRPVGSAYVEKFRSEGQLRGGALVGPVESKVAIVFDDLISSGNTMARAASICRAKGAVAIYGAASHGVFSRDASEVLGSSELERIVILDTIPPKGLSPELEARLMVIDCAPLLSTAVARLHTDGSLTELEGLEKAQCP